MQSKSDGPKRDEESFVCVGDIEWGYFHYGLFPPFSSPTVRVDRIANFLGILLFLFFSFSPQWSAAIYLRLEMEIVALLIACTTFYSGRMSPSRHCGLPCPPTRATTKNASAFVCVCVLTRPRVEKSLAHSHTAATATVSRHITSRCSWQTKCPETNKSIWSEKWDALIISFFSCSVFSTLAHSLTLNNNQSFIVIRQSWDATGEIGPLSSLSLGEWAKWIACARSFKYFRNTNGRVWPDMPNEHN